jgi:signal transduction histidine kinase
VAEIVVGAWDGQRSASLISRRMLWILLGTLVPLSTVVAALGLWPMWRTTLPLALAVSALFAAFFAVGVVLIAEPGHAPVGLAMILAAVLLIGSWANEWNFGLWPLFSQVVGDLWIPVVGWALYRYPHQKLARGDRWLFIVILIWFILTSWILVLLSRPQWHQFSTAWWPALFPNPGVYHFTTRIVDAGMVIIALTYSLRWVVRLHQSEGIERRIKMPTAIAGIAVIIVSSMLYVAYALNASESTENLLLGIAMGSTIAIPVAFLVAIIGRYLRRNALIGILINLGNSPTMRQITAALRDGLGDPDLLILYWSDDEQFYLDATRQAVGDPRQQADRLIVDIGSSTAGHPALLVADTALAQDPDLIDAAVIAARLLIENARLLETAQSRLADLQAASARIAKASDAERRRIQRDLHDGLQSRFAALGPRLGALKATTTDPRTAARITDILNDLTHALSDLRKLVADLQPDIPKLGLKGAVTDLCQSYGSILTVDVDLPEIRFSEPVELAAFLVVSEAMTNVAKHAQAESVTISGQVQDDILTITVADDGKGNATAGKGTGLIGMADRALALNGYVRISSPPGKGTRVTMRIPCE